MKVSEAINLADKYAGSPIESELKYRWLQQIEDIIYKEVILTHKDPPPQPAPVLRYDRELLCPEPYSELYIHYLNAQNDLMHRDTRSFENSASAFATAFSSFADWYNRTHSPQSYAERIDI
ncbi:MAG: hypothetical protein J6C03_06060 [Clostridia bacterium]|nr:hypothetical protein [Clostridia bacterium]